MGAHLFYTSIQTRCTVNFLSFIYKTETNEIFNTMIETTLQDINNVHEFWTLDYYIKDCSTLGIVIFGVK